MIVILFPNRNSIKNKTVHNFNFVSKQFSNIKNKSENVFISNNLMIFPCMPS